MTEDDPPALTPEQALAYLDRIGAPRVQLVSAEALAALQRAHLLSVPFENLDIALGRPIRLDVGSLFAKIVRQRRGGYCYELNGLFAALLRHLGYVVDLVSARVATPAGLTEDFDHLAVLVRVEDGTGPRWLVDVGFGDAFVEPLLLVDGFARDEGTKSVGLLADGTDWYYRERVGEADWADSYVFTEAPRRLSEFGPRNVWQQTSPESHFVGRRVTSLLTADGRVTLSNRRLIVTSNGERTEREVDAAKLDEVLAERFGITLTD